MLYLACLRAGAVYLPLNTAYTLAEIEYFIGDAEPRVVVCAPESRVRSSPLAHKLGVAAVETLGARTRTVRCSILPSRDPATFADVPRAATISPRSSTRPARPDARKARC